MAIDILPEMKRLMESAGTGKNEDIFMNRTSRQPPQQKCQLTHLRYHLMNGLDLAHVPVKEKRWVLFKGEEEDPTSLPVEWICWLSGQRKKAPTPQEMIELEAKREVVKLNVARLKKEEEERKSRDGVRRSVSTSKVGGPDLKSFIQQYPGTSLDNGSGSGPEEVSHTTDDIANKRFRESNETEEEKSFSPKATKMPISSEPSGSGESYKPGTWQPPT